MRVSMPFINAIDKKSQATLKAVLQSALQRLLTEDVVPAATVHVASASLAVDCEQCVGTRSRDSDQAYTPEQVFRVASNTKTYTAATVLRLQEEGLLTLDDLVVQHLPKAITTILRQGGFAVDALTPRHLLNHTAGIEDHAVADEYFARILAQPDHVWTPFEQIALLAEYSAARHPPGQCFAYSDTGYVILGQMIEQLSGMSLNDAIRHYLALDQLGLHRTWMENDPNAPAENQQRVHQYHEQHDTYYWHASMDLFGGGGLLSTARELSIFLRSLLRGEVLNDASMSCLHHYVADSLSDGYSMGLYKDQLGGHTAMGHTGAWNSFSFYIPEHDLVLSGAIMHKGVINGTQWASDLMYELNEAFKIKTPAA